MKLYSCFFKRIIDVLLALTALFFLSPVLFLVLVLIKIGSRGSVFYIKERVGKNERLFKFYKFRTMTDKDRNQYKQVFEGDSEITKVGAILRRTKIDELPQLLNVLKGDMSIIGPRPCLPNMKERFGVNWRDRFRVKPGLSSLAAVKGSIYLSFEEKGYWDKYYVDNLSFFMDLKIILKTIRIVFIGEKKLFRRNN
ncbi:Exopolysaccharide biosynthesis polyprenyl glycosylphosphotransferase [Tenacibaculum maritimum]|uniref:sugar transferase n=1 Tax=Tenacibaculum maritimum TaxID=107401 RepID=UPI0012E68AB8|nr:sugar transferase [Tenacibaculum maritimum]CAA0219604.1 Undecaprenyl phosphate N,N'-diacetylbacillosamine 1-phosphate transferase [Tenacibaculum maritimum]CAA0254952.1 Exopolysaccharide biosynthesis polyprenyl glycosylphosphotransferase [Tenacibaculum maritimum]CAA0260397.1 Exopolysaccharide biosynthesis polyprenyl glycosylphosphotransferase [Tenacibaculum maritimum]